MDSKLTQTDFSTKYGALIESIFPLEGNLKLIDWNLGLQSTDLIEIAAN